MAKKIKKVYCLMAHCEKDGVSYDELVSVFRKLDGMDSMIAQMNNMLSDVDAKYGPGRVKRYFYTERELFK